MFRTKPTRVAIFDGQSLNGIPEDNHFPSIIMRRIHTDRHWKMVAIGGASWVDLLNGTGSAAGFPSTVRLYPQVNGASVAVLCTQGGQGSIFQGRTGLQTYQDYKAYANAARSNGFTHIIGTTMPAVNSGWEALGWSQTRWADANSYIWDDPDNVFDNVVDLNVGILSVPDAPGFIDGLHFTEEGAYFCADLLQSAVEVPLAA